MGKVRSHLRTRCSTLLVDRSSRLEKTLSREMNSDADGDDDDSGDEEKGLSRTRASPIDSISLQLSNLRVRLPLKNEVNAFEWPNSTV